VARHREQPAACLVEGRSGDATEIGRSIDRAQRHGAQRAPARGVDGGHAAGRDGVVREHKQAAPLCVECRGLGVWPDTRPPQHRSGARVKRQNHPRARMAGDARRVRGRDCDEDVPTLLVDVDARDRLIRARIESALHESRALVGHGDQPSDEVIDGDEDAARPRIQRHDIGSDVDNRAEWSVSGGKAQRQRHHEQQRAECGAGRDMSRPWPHHAHGSHCDPFSRDEAATD